MIKMATTIDEALAELNAGRAVGYDASKMMPEQLAEFNAAIERQIMSGTRRQTPMIQVPEKFETPKRAQLSVEQMRLTVNNVCGMPWVTGRGLHACSEAVRHKDVEMARKAQSWLTQHGDKKNRLHKQTLDNLDTFLLEADTGIKF